MPEPVEPPKEPVVPSSVPGVVVYSIRQFLGLTAEKSQVLILCVLIGWFVYQSYETQKGQQTRDDERYAQDRRDKQDAEEKNRREKMEADDRAKAREIEVTKMVLTHCSAQEKIRRDDALSHMKEALEEIAKLRMAIVGLAVEVGKWKKPVGLEPDPTPIPVSVCPMPRAKP